ncbi:MAG TPA: hypothetical protein VGY54_02575 [Polyangiaceae bacterium]|nr:hypothetical protein [Polyangiaceae bacterium]
MRDAFIQRTLDRLPFLSGFVVIDGVLLFVLSVLVAELVSTIREVYPRPRWKRLFSLATDDVEFRNRAHE